MQMLQCRPRHGSGLCLSLHHVVHTLQHKIIEAIMNVHSVDFLFARQTGPYRCTASMSCMQSLLICVKQVKGKEVPIMRDMWFDEHAKSTLTC